MRVTVQAGEPWDAVVAGAVADGLAGHRVPVGHPRLDRRDADPERRRLRAGRRATIAAVRVLDRRRGAVEELPPQACGFAYRSSAFKGTATARRARGDLRARARGGSRSRCATPSSRARSASRSATARRCTRCARPCCALRRGKGMVIDPADPDSVSAGSFFTNPILEAEEFAALERRAAERLGAGVRPPRFPEPDGRVKTSAAWLIERAGFTRGLRRRPGRHLDQARARARQPRRRRPRPSWWRWRASSPPGCATPSASSSGPSRPSWASRSRPANGRGSASRTAPSGAAAPTAARSGRPCRRPDGLPTGTRSACP